MRDESSVVGRKFELWQSEYVTRAYTDQMGRKHDAWVVRRKVIVTVVDTRDTEGGWSGRTHKDGYWIAKDEAGVEYTQMFDETSMWGRSRWHDSLHNSWELSVKDGLIDPYMNPDGTKAVPQVLDA